MKSCLKPSVNFAKHDKPPVPPKPTFNTSTLHNKKTVIYSVSSSEKISSLLEKNSRTGTSSSSADLSLSDESQMQSSVSEKREPPFIISSLNKSAENDSTTSEEFPETGLSKIFCSTEDFSDECDSGTLSYKSKEYAGTNIKQQLGIELKVTAMDSTIDVDFSKTSFNFNNSLLKVRRCTNNLQLKDNVS